MRFAGIQREIDMVERAVAPNALVNPVTLTAGCSINAPASSASPSSPTRHPDRRFRSWRRDDRNPAEQAFGHVDAQRFQVTYERVGLSAKMRKILLTISHEEWRRVGAKIGRWRSFRSRRHFPPARESAAASKGRMRHRTHRCRRSAARRGSHRPGDDADAIQSFCKAASAAR